MDEHDTRKQHRRNRKQHPSCASTERATRRGIQLRPETNRERNARLGSIPAIGTRRAQHQGTTNHSRGIMAKKETAKRGRRKICVTMSK